jgi:AraC-like DNA-binding protein
MRPQPANVSIRAWESEGVLLEQYAYTAGAVEPLPAHAHEEYQFGLSVDCVGEYRYRGVRHRIPIGSLSAIHSGEAHAPSDRTFLPHPAHFAMMHLHPHWLETVSTELAGRPVSLPVFPVVLAADSRLNDLFLTLQTATHDHGSRLQQETALWELLAYLIQNHALNTSPVQLFRSSDAAVKLVRDYLSVHYASDVSLATLAAIAGLSRFHFCRVFRQTVGVSPSAYQTQRRIDQAKTLLVQGGAIAMVAEQTGFYDQSHFGYHFKRLVGVTPGRYVGK